MMTGHLHQAAVQQHYHTLSRNFKLRNSKRKRLKNHLEVKLINKPFFLFRVFINHCFQYMNKQLSIYKVNTFFSCIIVISLISFHAIRKFSFCVISILHSKNKFCFQNPVSLQRSVVFQTLCYHPSKGPKPNCYRRYNKEMIYFI